MRPTLLCIAVGLLTACGDSSSPRVAGPAVSITKTAGDNQTADPGMAVSVHPSVKVVDAEGIPVSGAVVTFSVGTGSGSITGPTPLTDANGIATVGTWTLGPTPGTANTLVASLGTLEPATFTATSSGVNPCSVTTPYTIGASIDGELTTTDCQGSDATYYDFFTTAISGTSAVQFTETSTSFDTYLVVNKADGSRIAENDDISASNGNSATKIILPATNLVIGANAYSAGAVGVYTLSSSVVSTSIGNCETVFVTRGITTDQTLATTDCSFGGYFSDDQLIYLPAGQSITVSMNSTDFDAYIEIYARGSAAAVASNDDASSTTTNAQVTFVSPGDDYYLIAPTSKLSGAQGVTGAYTLIIQ